MAPWAAEEVAPEDLLEMLTLRSRPRPSKLETGLAVVTDLKRARSHRLSPMQSWHVTTRGHHRLGVPATAARFQIF